MLISYLTTSAQSYYIANLFLRDYDSTPGRGTHIPSDVCSPTRTTHSTGDMCSSTLETHITSDICSPAWETHVTGEMFFPYLGTHIPSDMRSPTQGCQNAPATSIIACYFEVFGSSKWLEKSKKRVD